MKPFLLFISSLLLVVNFTAAQTDTAQPAEGSNAVAMPVFVDGTGNAVFRGMIDLYDYHASGLFVLGRGSSDTVRLVFMTEVGMTLLDMSFTEHDYTLNYCIEPLQKKRLLKLLKHDFALITAPASKLAFKRTTRHKERLYRYQKARYYQSSEEGLTPAITRIKTKGLLTRVDIHFRDLQEQIAHSIEIHHKSVNIHLVLHRLK